MSNRLPVCTLRRGVCLSLLVVWCGVCAACAQRHTAVELMR